MDLGAFSLSLAVRDIKASREFYGLLGFTPMEGADHDEWVVMKNGETVIGLFQGMFDKNILTFNPGWDQSGKETDAFTDVRELQKTLKAAGIKLLQEADESGSGPGECMLLDPDGNPILIDQHR